MKARSVAAFLCLAACQSPASSPAPPAAPSSVSTGESRLTAADALDRLDSRKPLPLIPMMAQHQKQNMREHLEAVQEVVAAAAARDFAKVAASAKRMGYSEAMGQMCEHMGSGAPGFTEQALAFHHSADRIADAASKNDATAVIGALAETLSTCTTCHGTYKQKLVDTLPE